MMYRKRLLLGFLSQQLINITTNILLWNWYIQYVLHFEGQCLKKAHKYCQVMSVFCVLECELYV